MLYSLYQLELVEKFNDIQLLLTLNNNIKFIWARKKSYNWYIIRKCIVMLYRLFKNKKIINNCVVYSNIVGINFIAYTRTKCIFQEIILKN
jgi:hypothetical protein